MTINPKLAKLFKITESDFHIDEKRVLRFCTESSHLALFLKEEFGGKVLDKTGVYCSPHFVWSLTGKKVDSFLENFCN